MNTKVCTKCKQEKPLSEFHKEAKSIDGHRRDCKECRNIKPEDKVPRTNNLNTTPKKCKLCGINYVPSSNRQEYCEECQLELARERCRKRYHKTKTLIGREHLRGENANGYKSGIGLYMNLAKEDGAKCERCDSTSNLLVHHKDRNRENNDRDNLEILCKSCHQKEHMLRDTEGRFASSK